MSDIFEEKEEKRKKIRAEVDQLIEVKNALLDVDIGKIVNISEDGFMLIGVGDIQENCLYQLTLSFARAVDDVFHLAVGAECLWINETGAGDQVWAGFHIIDIADDDRSILQKLSVEVEGS